MKDADDLVIGISLHNHVKDTSYNLCRLFINIQSLLIIRLAVIPVGDGTATTQSTLHTVGKYRTDLSA